MFLGKLIRIKMYSAVVASILLMANLHAFTAEEVKNPDTDETKEVMETEVSASRAAEEATLMNRIRPPGTWR